MINPNSITEKLLFSTVRLETEAGFGTGYIFNFETSDKTIVPVIITNKHVVNFKNVVKTKFNLHSKNLDLPTDENIPIELNSQWIFHPNKNIDLCCTPLAPILHLLKEKMSKEVYYVPINENLIFKNSQLDDLKAVEEVLMVGYPTGLFDIKNNLPLFRRGITSSHPAIDFNSDSIGVVDMACFPGSSGSPIFILNEGGYSDKNGSVFMGGSRLIFLGTLYGGPVYDSDGKIEVKEIPTQQRVVSKNRNMINLGYYIKAKEILTLKEQVFSELNI